MQFAKNYNFYLQTTQPTGPLTSYVSLYQWRLVENLDHRTPSCIHHDINRKKTRPPQAFLVPILVWVGLVNILLIPVSCGNFFIEANVVLQCPVFSLQCSAFFLLVSCLLLSRWKSVDVGGCSALFFFLPAEECWHV